MSKDGTLDLTKTWFNTDAGFVKAANAQPAQYQKRAFPFRLPDVRGPGFAVLNINVVRTFQLPKGATYQFRVDIQNLFNSVPWSNPNVDPTSTNFGKITSHPNSLMRFFTFVSRVTF
jgi:outer membrane receptor protein involved in Fe transport